MTMATFLCDLTAGYCGEDRTWPVWSVFGERVALVQTCNAYANGDYYHGWPEMQVGFGEHAEFELPVLSRGTFDHNGNRAVNKYVKEHAESSALLERIVDGHTDHWNGHNRVGAVSADTMAALRRLNEIVEEALATLPTEQEDSVDGIWWRMELDDDGEAHYAEFIRPATGRVVLRYADTGGDTCHDGIDLDSYTVNGITWTKAPTREEMITALDDADVTYEEGCLPGGEWDAVWITVDEGNLSAALEAVNSRNDEEGED
jgi:hypothetical protein